MSSELVLGASARDAVRPTGKIVPFFICAGVREEQLGYAVFPHGGTFGEMEVCPARDICTWYAAHDLGGEVAFNEQPVDRLLPVSFKTGAFSCPNFQDHAKTLRRQKPAKIGVEIPAACKCSELRRRTILGEVGGGTKGC